MAIAQAEGQISMFDVLEERDWFRDTLIRQLKRGSGFEHGKIRIYVAAMILDKDKFADFLQNEYYVGGNSIEGGFADYNGRGITIERWEDHEWKRFPWCQVQKEVRRLIADGQYLTDKEYQQIQEIARNHGGELHLPKPRMAYE